MRLTEKDWKDKRAGYPWTVHPVESYNDLKYYLKLAEYSSLVTLSIPTALFPSNSL